MSTARASLTGVGSLAGGAESSVESATPAAGASTVFDVWTVLSKRLSSKSRSTPYAGTTLLIVLCAACSVAPTLPHGADATSCGTCHARQFETWKSSAHARGTASPVFQALLPKVEAAWGEAARQQCVSCHSPGHGGDDGVSCVSCHAATGNRGEKNGALVVDLERPLASTKTQLQNDAHAVAPRGLLTSASLCGTCHEVHGPGLFDERTLSEFRSSDGEDSCLSCHGVGGADGHRFAGVDPAWGAPPSERAEADVRARELWAKGLELTVEPAGQGVRVTLTNQARHSVPTGVAMLRDVWVDLEVRDTKGSVLVVPRLLELRATLEREGVPVALITDATRVGSGALAPNASRSMNWSRAAGASGALEIHAVVRARAVRSDVLEALGLQERSDEVTTHEVTRRTVQLNAVE